MLKIFLISSIIVQIITTYGIPLSSSLGTIRACRCYTRPPFPISLSRQQVIEPTSSAASISYGPAEICHCMPTISTTTSDVTDRKAVNIYEQQFINNHKGKCWYGPFMQLHFTLAETGKLYMCNKEVASGSRNEMVDLNLKGKQYPCSDFVFKITNPDSSPKYLGVSFILTIRGATFVASTPDRWELPSYRLSVTALAGWSTTGNCDNPLNLQGAKVVQYLVFVGSYYGTNKVFKSLSDQLAWPLGASTFSSMPGAVQCIIINNPFCFEDMPYA